MVQKSKSNTYINDVVSLTTSRLLVAGLGFLAGVLLARLLGPANQGVITTILVVPLLVISFADLGMRQAATYYLGKKIYDDQVVISTVSLMSILTSLISVVITFVVYHVLGYDHRYGTLIIWIPLFYIPLQIFIQFGTGILMAKQRIREIAIANGMLEVIYLILLFPLFLLSSYQIEYALLAYVMSSFITVVFLVQIIKGYAKLSPIYIHGIPWQFLKLGIVYGIALFVLGLHYRVDVMILERLSNATQVGIYSIGVGVAEKLWLLPTALTTVNFARSAVAKDPLDHAHKTAKVLRVVLWIGILPCLLLYVLSPWLIPFIYGEVYQASGSIVQAILPGVWAALVFKILNSDLAGRGRPEAALWVYGLALLLNIGLNFWWVPLFGAVGSAWASSITYILGAALFATVYARMSNVSLVDLFVIRKSDFEGLSLVKR